RALVSGRPTTSGTRTTRRLRSSCGILFDVVPDPLRDVDVDQERQLVVFEAEVLDADVALLVPDLERVDALDPRHLLDEVDQLCLEHGPSELPALPVAAACQRVEVPPQLELDVLAEPVRGADGAPDQDDADR